MLGISLSPKQRTSLDQNDIDPTKPHAFLSYTHSDDDYFDGGISALREALEKAVRATTGEPFKIFQDVEDIRPSDAWERKLDRAIEAAQLFIPILTPSFFTSAFCRREAKAFLDHEVRAERCDLVLPIYLLDAERLNEETLRKEDEIARRLHERQYADWRMLGFHLRDSKIRPQIHELAGAIASAVVRTSGIAPPPAETSLRLDVQLSALEVKVAEREEALTEVQTRNKRLEAALAKRDKEAEQRAGNEKALMEQIEQLTTAPGVSGRALRIAEPQLGGRQMKMEPPGLRPTHAFGIAGLALMIGLIGGWMGARDKSILRSTDTTSLPNERTNQLEQHAVGRASEPTNAEVSVADAQERKPAVSSATAVSALTSGDSFKDCSICPEMIVIPGGSFSMGSSSSEKISYAVERPIHEVNIQAFALGKYEVSFAEWDACVDAGGCIHRPDDQWGRADQPLINVSWVDAHQYTDWLSEQTGRRYRLPSEAEWEYAARGGTETAYFWGDDVGKNLANCKKCGSKWGGKQPAPVGSFAPNAFGLHDMHGNIWEWVEDVYQSNYQDAPVDGRPWILGGSKRVRRGGYWGNYAKDVRSASRGRDTEHTRRSYLGFRVSRASSE